LTPAVGRTVIEEQHGKEVADAYMAEIMEHSVGVDEYFDHYAYRYDDLLDDVREFLANRGSACPTAVPVGPHSMVAYDDDDEDGIRVFDSESDPGFLFLYHGFDVTTRSSSWTIVEEGTFNIDMVGNEYGPESSK
jgi:hypothetical protein